MGKSSNAVQEVYARLSRDYPDTNTELTYKNPYELIIAVILSAQCTDARVNLTTPALFEAYPSPQALANAPLPHVEKLIHACGFFRAKAKSITGAARGLVERFEGRVPNTMEDLVSLPGVGRKTASVVLNQAFDLPAIAVDTHVARVSHRLGWTTQTDPVKIERDLCALLPPEQWSKVNGMLILHGRRVCKARKPSCESCSVAELCRFYQSAGAAKGAKTKPKAAKKPVSKPAQRVRRTRT